MSIDAWSASSFGSVFADAPGVLRENGWTVPYHCVMDAADGATIGICSGSTQTATGGSTLMPLLEEGQSISIYSIQGTNSQESAGFVFSLNASGYVESGDGGYDNTVMVGSATKSGPWFQHFELPLRVDGPAGLYWKGIETTGGSTYNFLVMQYIIVDQSGSVIS